MSHKIQSGQEEIVRRLRACSQEVQKLEQRVTEGKPVSEMVYQLRSTVAGLRIAGEFLVEQAAKADPHLSEEQEELLKLVYL